MFPEQLKKILDLIKQTGDRVVIYDGAHSDETYVVMSLDSYAAGLSQTAKSAAVPVITSASSAVPSAPVAPAPSLAKSLTEEDLTDKINREISMWKNKENSPLSAEDSQPKKAWQIPSTVKDKAQEVE
jgi:hypothetical protein